jgi:hypothetical protein
MRSGKLGPDFRQDEECYLERGTQYAERHVSRAHIRFPSKRHIRLRRVRVAKSRNPAGRSSSAKLAMKAGPEPPTATPDVTAISTVSARNPFGRSFPIETICLNNPEKSAKRDSIQSTFAKTPTNAPSRRTRMSAAPASNASSITMLVSAVADGSPVRKKKFKFALIYSTGPLIGNFPQ